MEAGAVLAPILRDAAQGRGSSRDNGAAVRGDDGECEASKEAKTNEQAIRVSPNRLLVEDLSAIGYPRPAPSLTASDHVFFEGRTARTEKRSTAGSSRFTFLPVCAMKRKGRHARA
jgi:hypothetical protein